MRKPLECLARVRDVAAQPFGKIAIATEGLHASSALIRSSRYGPANATAASSLARAALPIESGVSAGMRRSAVMAASRLNRVV